MGNITKFLLLFGIITLVTFSCVEEDEPPCACGVENPQDNLEWLYDLLYYPQCIEIYSIMYQSQEYIGLYDCGGSSGKSYYDCDGNYICGYNTYDGDWTCDDDFTEAIKNKKLIYKREYDPNWEPKY